MMTNKEAGQDVVKRARELLARFTPYDGLYPYYIPSQGWAVCWKNTEGEMIPVCHARWTDGLRPEIDIRLENECALFAAAPELISELCYELEVLREFAPDGPLFCSCGAALSLAGYVQHRRMGHDAGLAVMDSEKKAEDQSGSK